MQEKEKNKKSVNKNNLEHNKIILVGNANVGKSVIFSLLTGRYATVSNYPGTTVEISNGITRIGNKNFEVIDTPGISDFFGRTDDQRVTRDILLENPNSIIVNVIDAKNLKRGLILTVFLCQLGMRQVIALNMMDEANDKGIFVDHKKLAEIFKVPVVPMIATERVGLHQLKEAILKASPGACNVSYSEDAEKFISGIESKLPETSFTNRRLALFIAGATDQIQEIYKKMKVFDVDMIEATWEQFQYTLSQPINYLLTTSIMKKAEDIANSVSRKSKLLESGQKDIFNKLTIHPISGILIVFVVLFFMYLIVGRFGAGFLVDILENKLFGQIINPFFIKVFSQSNHVIRDFFVGDYGIITMALSYGLGIVLPITAIFFLFFGFLEDCGYFPRLAFLTDAIFKSMGLTGRAVLPLVLGLGCGTMATLTTRILDTKKEKIIATVLLAVAIPCSAQLGVVLGILGAISKLALFVWAISIFIVMVIIGGALNFLIPGETRFSMEIPPLRLPYLRNIGIKTGRRIIWYLKEALPLFILGTIILFILNISGVLSYIISFLSPVVMAMGLPVEMSKVFMMGFLRRDYGAAGMFDLYNDGLLSPGQSVVGAVVLTLFVPCVAQFFVMIKERGILVAIAIFFSATVIAFLSGFLLSAILTISGIF
ncbi:MAG: ferrous iron transport protein B [Candidatus Omnitrophica bacterium]|nr:ferrous iron transport protein B [Candidatus Omnitrophota bacterium]